MFLIREQVSTYGAENTTDLVILTAIVGSQKVAERLLKAHGSLYQLSIIKSVDTFMQVEGVTETRAVRLVCALELVNRVNTQRLQPGSLLNGSRDVFHHFHDRLRDERKEKMFAVLFDGKHKIIGERLISIGSLNISIVHPREIFKPAISASADSILLVHNHPSGDPAPSREDIYTTKRLVDCGKMVGISVLDHIIVGNGCYVSFIEQKLM
jgi:DNA repair protein RadC